MDYNHITNFLDKFKKLVNQKEEIKEIVLNTIKEEIPYPIEKESLIIKKGFILINSSPVLRSEILIHKEQIFKKLKILLPDTKFLDIK
ncbi:MAG TPA: hypothetical protein VK153_03425 [Candidatus Paceibacterota bacterium]|nr:hypothetical protein [Candidatus Paceibacterota bacterium]